MTSPSDTLRHLAMAVAHHLARFFHGLSVRLAAPLAPEPSAPTDLDAVRARMVDLFALVGELADAIDALDDDQDEDEDEVAFIGRHAPNGRPN